MDFYQSRVENARDQERIDAIEMICPGLIKDSLVFIWATSRRWRRSQILFRSWFIEVRVSRPERNLSC